MICNKIIAYSNDIDIGFIDLYNYLNQLINEKNNISTPNVELKNKLKQFDLTTFDNMNINQIKSKIGHMKKMFYNIYEKVGKQKNDLENIIIIKDNELSYAESQLEKINNILRNSNFSNTIKSIEYRIRLGTDTKEDQMKYSFYKNLEEQAKYLKFGQIKK
jgi:hypothetical protein